MTAANDNRLAYTEKTAAGLLDVSPRTIWRLVGTREKVRALLKDWAGYLRP